MALDSYSVLIDWIRDGPQPEDGTLGWAIGMMLHWRMWGMMFLWLIPMIVGLHVFNVSNGVYGVMATWLLCTIIAPHALNIGTKYEVTKNY